MKSSPHLELLSIRVTNRKKRSEFKLAKGHQKKRKENKNCTLNHVNIIYGSMAYVVEDSGKKQSGDVSRKQFLPLYGPRSE